MRPLLPFAAVVVAAGTALLLHGCQETAEVTGPELARAKPARTLTVTGGGSGSGKITAPVVGEVGALTCTVTRGTYDPTVCTKTYGWKTSVLLSAEADPGGTFTGWSGACTGTGNTCKVMMTQSRNVQANFAGAGVQSFNLTVVGAGTGNGTVRSAAGPTPAINCTITAGTGTGACSGTYVSETSIGLIATATSGTFNGWSGDCTGTGSCSVTLAANRAVTATFTSPPGPEASAGKWAPSATTPIIGLHLSYLSNGRALLWGHGGEPQLWNPSGGGFIQVANNTCTDPQTCKLFCSGHTFLADGRLLVAGGHNEALGDGNGLKQASTFNGTSWSSTGSMSYARWYPTLVELENGDVVALSGSQDPGVNATIPERYNGSTWTSLTGAQLSLPLYPRAFLEPKNGWIFYAGEGSPRYLNPSGAGSWSSAPARVVGERSYGSAVMLDSKVLYLGGGGGGCPGSPQNTAEMIDLAASAPSWTPLASMSFRRRQTNATILPDGTVLVTGGTSACGFTDPSGGVFAAENYEPPPVNRWSTWANASIVRVYHSTAMLLRDGRVLFTGSGDGAGVPQQFNYETFSPPYLFKGPRPTYNLASTTVRYGQTFTITTPNALSIRKVTIIRHGSTTHAFDQGQRLNTLTFQASLDGQSLAVTPPASGRIAPPGPYMLFILDDKGVPSVAETILLSQ